jgi:hypothetical protein
MLKYTFNNILEKEAAWRDRPFSVGSLTGQSSGPPLPSQTVTECCLSESESYVTTDRDRRSVGQSLLE